MRRLLFLLVALLCARTSPAATIVNLPLLAPVAIDLSLDDQVFIGPRFIDFEGSLTQEFFLQQIFTHPQPELNLFGFTLIARARDGLASITGPTPVPGFHFPAVVSGTLPTLILTPENATDLFVFPLVVSGSGSTNDRFTLTVTDRQGDARTVTFVAAVPEPSSLMLLGPVLVGLWRRRHR